MDSEHRQELKENDLLAFFRNFNEWFNKHGTPVLLGIALVVAAFVGVRWFTGQEARMREAAWRDFAATATPEGLAQLAEEYRGMHGFAAMSLLEAGDMLRRQVVIGLGPNAEPPSTSGDLSESQQSKLNRAAGYYRRIVDNPDSPRLQKLNACLALGATELTLGKREEARRWYSRAADEAGPFQNIAAIANDELAELDRLPERIAFARRPAGAGTEAGSGDGDGSEGTAAGEAAASANEPAGGDEGALATPSESRNRRSTVDASVTVRRASSAHSMAPSSGHARSTTARVPSARRSTPSSPV